MKKRIDLRLLTLGLWTFAAFAANAQEAEAGSDGFFAVVAKGGALGIILWLALAALSVAGTHLIVDSFIKIRNKRIIPEELVGAVRGALGEEDVDGALASCGKEPGSNRMF